MLSPAVRSVAQHLAITAPLGQEEGWLKNDRVNFYLRGYSAGYTAPREHRFPLAGDAAFKRLLGQYLAERITVFHPATGRYGLLRGLPYCAQHDGEPYADVEFYCDAEAREEGGGDLVEDVNKILPTLYSLADLPALYDSLPEELQQQIGGRDVTERLAEWIDSWTKRINLLRAAGFAVGLAPHQYHRRVPGFDYASGERPEKCAGCKGKEVCRA